jgi:hypothetical protein
VVVLVTTREACIVCGSLAGVFPPCDCFGYNPRDQKGEVCVSLSVFHRALVLVTTREACTVCGSLAGVFPREIVLVTTHVIRSAQYVFLWMFSSAMWWFWWQPQKRAQYVVL